MEPLCTFQVHQSGINSCHYKILQPNCFIFLTGGDDTAVVVSYFKLTVSQENSVEIERTDLYSCSQAHCAQVSGVYLTDNLMISASSDQSIVVYKWSVVNSKIKVVYENKYKTAVSDIQGFCCIRRKHYLMLLAYGNGLEILKICL